MKHHVSLALLLTLPAALTLALLPPITNEPHYLFHRQDDRTVSVQQSYAPLDMTELALINTASRTAEAPPEDGKYLRFPDQTEEFCKAPGKPCDHLVPGELPRAGRQAHIRPVGEAEQLAARYR